MSGLIRNEMIKMYKSGFVKAAICIILIFCVLIPVGNLIISNSFDPLYENDFLEMADREQDEVAKEYYLANARIENFFSENNIAYSDWRYNEFYASLSSIEMTKTVFELMKKGKTKGEVENFFMYEDMNAEISVDESGYVERSEDNYKNIFQLTDKEKEEYYGKICKIYSDLKNTIIAYSVSGFYEANIRELEEQKKEFEAEKVKNEKELEKLKKIIEASAQNGKEPENRPADKYIIRSLDEANGNIKAIDIQLEVQQYLLDNKIDYNSWRYRAADIISMASAIYTDPLMKEDYFHAGNDLGWRSYEEYCKQMNDNIRTGESAIKIARYSLEHDIPLPECLEDSERLAFSNYSSYASVMVSVLMVLIAAITMYTEYSSGSIRLLLIRPKSRNKILLSKLITVILYGLFAAAASAVILFVLSKLCHTDSDMFIPYLTVTKSGQVKEIPFAVYMLMKAGLKYLSAFAIVSAAFMISTVFMKGGILSLLLFSPAVCGASVVASISQAINGDFKNALTYTVLPYLDLSQFIPNPVSSYSGEFTMLDLFSETATEYPELSFTAGAVMITAHIAVFLIISFVCFNKKQIKN